MKADLHIHSTASDGHLTPEELVAMAADLGLEVISITDHDSIDGVAPALEAAQAYTGLKLIAGVEVSTDVPHGEVHILGYFINHLDPELRSVLERLRNSRVLRAQKMVAKLAELGMDVDWGRVQKIAGSGSIGRPHIAQALVERGHVSSFKEAFTRFIGRDGPAYVEREKLTPEQVVELIVKAGGLPVLAHPADMQNLEWQIAQLQKVGLVGIEAYYDGYTRGVVRYLASLAAKYGLITTGGSDFHGLGGMEETPLGGVDVPAECIRRLFRLAREKNLCLAEEALE
ncbi:MAG: PHP domain-containing protein [Chloroflexi bacterium]|nr:MAG: PHP domain-containing protein [Chloroflexota bacterium]RLC96019.1 MAG: PHP domain-containing protein [Chloroflexota bacterium]